MGQFAPCPERRPEQPTIKRGIFDAHALWHLFVIGGSACCFWLMIRYVAPLG